MTTPADPATETEPKPSPYVHLHVHSEYSLLDGAIRIKDLLKQVQAFGQKACAITDHGNLFGAIEFYLKAKSAGIKAIIGCEIFHPGSQATAAALQPEQDDQEVDEPFYHLVLLAKNNDGYKHLIRLVSLGFLDELKEVPQVAENHLDDLGGGLIALSSCQRGEFGTLVRALREAVGQEAELPLTNPGHAADIVHALQVHVAQMEARFGKGHYYIELIDNGVPGQAELLHDLVAVAKHFDLPLVASCDAHYLTPEYAEAHAVLLGIKHGLKMTSLRNRLKNTRFHLFTDDEMTSTYGAWPEALANTQKIADECNVSFEFGEYYLPKFDTGTDEDADTALKRIASEMLEERFEQLAKVYGPSFDDDRRTAYRERLKYELDVISNMGFPGYFLIVQDFINWAKEHDIPVGPGRGSGAGSIVAYALRITDIDPLPYNLLFERFLNPERVSMPDFDVDFCQDRRDEVIDYVNERYGADNVAQITTFGKMNAKAVIRDVGRVLELGYGRVDRIAKLIPDELGINLTEALEKEPRLQEEADRDETVANLLRLCLQLEGLCRHTSVHAAGVVISDGPMINYVPVYTTEEDGLITQYEMKMAETVGLVKFDFLGLKTLTVIQKAVQFVQREKQPDFDISLIPMDDRDVYRQISLGNTVGIFQLESAGMRQLITKLKPSCFEDIIAVVALFRPGPLGSGMDVDFIERKHGRQEIEYILPQLEPILKETYGTILYQEQVMKIAGELASYSLGEADLLRRAMGKKIASEMEKQKVRFVTGAIDNKIDEAKATEIFDLMAEFAKYGFNKSHSAAYGLVSYQTAYMKTHYPAEFMAAIMTCDLDNTKKIVRYVDEVRRMRIKILPPDINRSELEFDVPAENTIGFGLAAIKGIGEQALEPIVSERRANGAFSSLTDLARRVPLHKVGKKTLELLTQVGALDGFGMSRPKLSQIIPDIVKFSENHHGAQQSGQRGLFDDASEQDDALGELSWDLAPHEKKVGAPNPAWLAKEKSLLGVYLTGHPLAFHQEDCKRFGHVTLNKLESCTGKRDVAVVGILAMMNERLTKKGTRMASVRLEDETGYGEAVMFQDDLPEEFPPANELVRAVGNVDTGFDGSLRFRLSKIEALSDYRQEHVQTLHLRLKPNPDGGRAGATMKDATGALVNLLSNHAGDVPVALTLDYGDATVRIGGSTRHVQLDDHFLHELELLPFAEKEVAFQLLKRKRRSQHEYEQE